MQQSLYRHGSGHWTMISERTHTEAPCSCGKCARRYDDADAADWLVCNGFELPSDIASLAVGSFFRPGPPIPAPKEPNDGGIAKPKWDEDRRELFVNGVVCKKFRQNAPNQTRILAAFEDCGWPPRIDDPIPPNTKVDRRERLSDTVRSLNNGCKCIRFELDGTTEGIIWSVKEGTDDASPSVDMPF